MGGSRQRVFDAVPGRLIGRRARAPKHLETTALGAAFLAGLAVGVWANLDTVRQAWLENARFNRAMPADEVASRVAGWAEAIQRT